MTKPACNVCGVVFASKAAYLRHVADARHATVQFRVPSNNTPLPLYQAVTALVQTHGWQNVQNTITLFAPAAAQDDKCTRPINAGYFRRDECKCQNCTTKLKAEMQQAEDDFNVWQREQMQEIEDAFLAEWKGPAALFTNDYETTESLFD